MLCDMLWQSIGLTEMNFNTIPFSVAIPSALGNGQCDLIIRYLYWRTYEMARELECKHNDTLYQLCKRLEDDT